LRKDSYVLEAFLSTDKIVKVIQAIITFLGVKDVRANMIFCQEIGNQEPSKASYDLPENCLDKPRLGIFAISLS
jgi:hypothetical protein